MEGTEGLNNMERFYAQRANDAIEAFNSGQFDKCDEICTDLLTRPRLPYLWRAQSNLLMASKKDNTALEYAKDALKYYDIMLAEDPDDDYLQENRHEAQLLFDAAEKRLKTQAEVEVDEADEEVAANSGDDDEAAGEKSAGGQEEVGIQSGDDDIEMIQESATGREEVSMQPGDVMESVEGDTAGSDQNVKEGVEDGVDESIKDDQGPMLPPAIEHAPPSPGQPTEGRDSRATTVVPTGSSQTTAVVKDEQANIEMLEPLKEDDSTGSESSGKQADDSKK